MSELRREGLGVLRVGWPGVFVNTEYEKRQITDLLLQYDCVPVFPPKKEFTKFLEFSHSLLWPILHDVMLFLVGSPQPFSEDQWAAYQRVNALYADVVVRCSHTSDCFWVHDYHLLLVPQYLTRRMRKVMCLSNLFGGGRVMNSDGMQMKGR